jgi:ABC-type thiamin/hydroxymethylpyrimidine transport system permease subunit
MNMKWKTKEIVIVAMLAVVIGVIYTLMDAAYMPLSAILGPVFMELTFGVYLLSAALPMYIARKPGFALFGALVTAGANLLLGSPYGIQLVLAGVLQAGGTEIGYLIGGKHKGSYINITATGILSFMIFLLFFQGISDVDAPLKFLFLSYHVNGLMSVLALGIRIIVFAVMSLGFVLTTSPNDLVLSLMLQMGEVTNPD